jgi:predicted dienelactone hydrolase
MSRPPFGRRVLKGCGCLVSLGILGVVSLIAFLAAEHRMDVTLPAPTGTFAVGRMVLDWVDDQHVDALSPDKRAKRELLVWMWYPTTAGRAIADSYIPAQIAPKDPPQGPLVWNLLTRDLAKVHGHSLREPALAPDQPTYPVLIMRGGASAPVVNYSTLAEDLASHGYVVVGFDAPYRTGHVAFPDGRSMGRTDENNPELCQGPTQSQCLDRLLDAWTSDIGFALDRLQALHVSDPAGRLTGRLDLTRVGVFGHSFGGTQAAQFCATDTRCTAGVDIDGGLFGKVAQVRITRPFMFLLSDHGDSPTDDPIAADLQAVYDRMPHDTRLRLAIRGANHFTFSDDGALLKSHVIRGVLRLFGKLDIDGRRQLAVTTYSVRSFFDVHLRSVRLELPSPRYPELIATEARQASPIAPATSESARPR